MQLKLFIVPVKDLSVPEAEMNAFLRSHRVLALRKEFVGDGENSFWTFCVEYLDSAPAGSGLPPGSRPPKVDYKEVLKPEEFEVFSRPLAEVRTGSAAALLCGADAGATDVGSARLAGKAFEPVLGWPGIGPRPQISDLRFHGRPTSADF